MNLSQTEKRAKRKQKMTNESFDTSNAPTLNFSQNTYQKNQNVFSISEDQLRYSENRQSQKWSQNEESKVQGDLSRRVMKEGKYSTIITILMNMLRDMNLFQLSKTISKNYSIKQQKSYQAIAFRLGLIFNHKVVFLQTTEESALRDIFERIEGELNECIMNNYCKTNNQSFTKLVEEKCLKDIKVFEKALKGLSKNKYLKKNNLKNLYLCNKMGHLSIKNMKQAKKLGIIMAQAVNEGPKYSITKKALLKQIEIQSDSEKSDFENDSDSDPDLVYWLSSREIDQFMKSEILSISLKDLCCPKETNKQKMEVGNLV